MSFKMKELSSACVVDIRPKRIIVVCNTYSTSARSSGNYRPRNWLAIQVRDGSMECSPYPSGGVTFDQPAVEGTPRS